MQPPINPHKLMVGQFVQVGMFFVPTQAEFIVTPPAALTTLDSVPIASVRTVYWHYSAWAVTTSTMFAAMCFAGHDGVAAYFVDGIDALLGPPAGLFDFTMSVDINAGFMRLRTTPLTATWTFNVRRVSTTSA